MSWGQGLGYGEGWRWGYLGLASGLGLGVRLRAKAQVNLGVRVRVWVTVWGKAHRVLGGRGVGLLALHVVEDAEVVALRPLLRPPAQADRPLVLMRVVDRITREGPQPG